MTHYPPSEDLLQEAFSKGFEQVRRRCVAAEAERDAAVAENARLLARIAAVEALRGSAELVQRCHGGRITHVGNKTHGGEAEYREMCPVCIVPSPCRTERLLTDLFAALAASPAPTTEEQS